MAWKGAMNSSPNSISDPYELKSRLLRGGYIEEYIGVTKEDSRSLDCGSYEPRQKSHQAHAHPVLRCAGRSPLHA